MNEILSSLGISEYDIIDDGVEVSLKNSNDFGKVYTKLDNTYDVDEDISSMDSVIFIDGKYKINLIADFSNNTYMLRITEQG